ncbi:MAG: hypothetical protein SPJ16_04400 [Helicobacter sp.]|uniref:hypothetical protein n=1 Tax=Helicobacter sp. TaxID=218 RepID=UPI002A920968|nr:hypothetical protein [Helicobacter sp.]MDY5950418.1 hypothetical protein [Helicobacter sp.]
MENVKKIQAKIFRLFRNVRTSETLAYTCKYDKNLDFVRKNTIYTTHYIMGIKWRG